MPILSGTYEIIQRYRRAVLVGFTIGVLSCGFLASRLKLDSDLLNPLPEDLPRSAPPTAEATEALEAIRSLPEAYRETLMLRLVGGRNGPEIAERTGRTPASVRVNLHRGMKLLRSKLGLKGGS